MPIGENGSIDPTPESGTTEDGNAAQPDWPSAGGSTADDIPVWLTSGPSSAEVGDASLEDTATPEAAHSPLREWLAAHLNAKIVDSTLANLEAQEVFDVPDLQLLRAEDWPRFASCFKVPLPPHHMRTTEALPCESDLWPHPHPSPHGTQLTA
jgi:hypothetical protein